jgi:hypothetical protein
MRFAVRVLPVAVLLAALAGGSSFAQEPAPAPTPAPPPVADSAAPVTSTNLQDAPASTVSTPALAPPPAPQTAPSARIVESSSVSIAKLPTQNPYGKAVDVPAALPQKLPFTDAKLTTGDFVSARVDATGKVLQVRRDRDPIPSLAGETMRSIQRWTITPARRGGQAVDTWGAYRLELAVEIDAPKILQQTLTSVTPQTPMPAPFSWPAEAEWLESRKPAAPSDGTVSILEVDTAPVPTKTPWSADSFKGPFSVRYWIKIDKNGHIERAIPLEVSDPVLLAYFRRAMAGWVLRPAQAGGAPVDSWNELSLSGTISFDDDIKQISALRRSIGP